MSLFDVEKKANRKVHSQLIIFQLHVKDFYPFIKEVILDRTINMAKTILLYQMNEFIS